MTFSRSFSNQSHDLGLAAHLFLLSLHSSLPLVLQELPLLFCTHAFEPVVPHLLFLFLAFQSSLLGFLLIICFSKLLLFFLTRGLNLTPHFRTKAGVLSEQIRKAQEVGEDWESGFVGRNLGRGWDLEG